MKDESRYRSREWFRQRIKVLDDRTCTTQAQLQATLDEMVELSVGEMRAGVARAILDGFARLVQATPKDTGRAQAGWQISSDASVLDYVPPTIKRPEGAGKKKAGGDDILPEYAAMIREAVPSGASLTEADVIYIVNNVEYIMMLEAGWSKKQPSGFIGNFLNTLKKELNALAAGFGGRA